MSAWRLWSEGRYVVVQAGSLHEAMMTVPRPKRLKITKGERAGGQS